jgi:hypothetical protein
LIWDSNHNVPENEQLRLEGFKVFGGGEFANNMEHDRQACLDFASPYGLEAPPSFQFADAGEAIRFCKDHRETAYVYKPDEGAKFKTFLPESEDPMEANEELQVHLASIENHSAFILLERKEGVETNVEVWFQNRDPAFAFMDLECVRNSPQVQVDPNSARHREGPTGVRAEELGSAAQELADRSERLDMVAEDLEHHQHRYCE